ncbi:hypothetical protein GOP47_0015608 [Adiantum capillus-veneris]|uniref:Pentatricopeptide repeat-containing protein n=1 Tax=Adiantum capillus-veneris TaxID=13818 RepID=A0A9D4ZCS7_ADICA|nr:hypothetical protein GOP47_0015608 [Adiantum capillus-veneris]
MHMPLPWCFLALTHSSLRHGCALPALQSCITFYRRFSALLPFKDQQSTPMSWDSIHSLLQDCAHHETNISFLRKAHVLLTNSGLTAIAYIGDYLIRLFTTCKCLSDAHQVFCKVSQPTVYTWHAIISAHMKLGESERGLELYLRMQQEGVKPNKFVFLCILKICGSEKGAKEGRLIHDQIIRSGHESDMPIQNTLVDMYSKCGSLEEACCIFDRLQERSIVSWGAMMAGYAAQGVGVAGLKTFRNMLSEDIKPSKLTFLGVLKACWIVGILAQGRVIHAQVIGHNFESGLVVANALIDMYAKCGSLDEARNVFDDISSKDGVSYNSMIQGYVQQELGLPALDLYSSMRQRRIRPNRVTFPTILKACSNVNALVEGREIHADVITRELDSDLTIQSALVDIHAGEVDEGRWYFTSMVHDYGMKPSTDHFNCMIDLFGRAGRLDDARDMFQSIPQQLDVNGWTALFTSCRMYGNKELGNECFAEAKSLDLSHLAGSCEKGGYNKGCSTLTVLIPAAASTSAYRTEASVLAPLAHDR